MMRILLQFPEGLKAKALEISRKLEKEGNEVFLSASPCYGACDVAVSEAEAIHADKIIHYGHAPFPLKRKAGIAIEYAEYPAKADFRLVLKKALADADFAKCRRIGLVTTVQHVGQIGEIRRFLEKNGKKVLVGKHGPSAKYDGQILGCDPGAAVSADSKADCILYFGGGRFHPVAAAIACRHRVMAADPFLGKVAWMDGEREKYLKRRKGLLMAAISAKRFGVIISTKPGQFALEAARRLKAGLEEVGKEAAILVADRIDAEALENFRSFDFYVNTACPRIAIDDYERFGKPILTLAEAEELVRLLRK